jgi:hypothetical protein
VPQTHPETIYTGLIRTEFISAKDGFWMDLKRLKPIPVQEFVPAEVFLVYTLD